ncbi:sulfotransferase family 2 domain-containing protein [Pseudemcibacter aquimaris]|uniref:sulfotransferase family 2 domain-containing protein n=1 Tax=Pseudemcibacter aquimaris TaxID=2857064 RepID=UPI002012129A|nr:sulfotransferase family 2 domain-containing protein [Pseudemcibacter aquimaris]MCC3860006.1 sulfotransferase family protein [Pseudemcibacter aquimaris]WDU57337.1 sulfotransferase family protein [Pseudemcibacter aquimaris]
MIISHEHKIIFLKTKKVAGTSFEMALSKFCGPDCIITPISPVDEKERTLLGFRPSQNYLEKDRVGVGVTGHPNCNIRGDFANHDTAEKIFHQISDEMFNDYLKISIYRNPLDFLISYYYFYMRNLPDANRVPFKYWVANNHHRIKENYQIAPETGPYAADIIMQYENIDSEIMKLDRLPSGFVDLFFRLNAKGNFRDAKSRNTYEFYMENGFTEQELKFLRNVK